MFIRNGFHALSKTTPEKFQNIHEKSFSSESILVKSLVEGVQL